jgi:hypothetical protein
MLDVNKQKELDQIINLHRDWVRGETFEDTKLALENSSDDRISYLLETADMKMKYEMIITILDTFDTHRSRKLLLPYTEFLSFIKEVNRGKNVREVYEELYFMALEQIKTKYIPTSGITTNII